MNVSVIIPVYNRGKTIQRCLQSILSQTYQDYEVIVVDDGSTDQTREVCSHFVCDKLKVIQQPNSGVSVARNTGIEHASGVFLAFIDSDDYVDPSYLEMLVQHCALGELCIGGWITHTARKVEETDLSNYPDVIPFNKKDSSISRLLQNGSINPVWGKLFRRDIINAHKLRFDPHLTNGEDLVFNCSYIEHVNHICVVKQTGYHYTKDDGDSITSTCKKVYFRDYLKIHHLLSSWNVNEGFLYSMYCRYRKEIGKIVSSKSCWEQHKTELYLFQVNFSDPEIKQSFSNYHPYNWKDSIVHHLILRKKWQLLRFIFRISSF
jgi:glycosyltransferase involved in cell wall biosynthesis